MQTPGVQVQLSIDVCSRRPAIGDEQDVFLGHTLPPQQGAGKAQASLGIGVLPANRDVRQVAQRNLARGVAKPDNIQGITGEVDTNQLGQRQCHFLGRSEAVTAKQLHAGTHVQHDDRSTVR